MDATMRDSNIRADDIRDRIRTREVFFAVAEGPPLRNMTRLRTGEPESIRIHMGRHPI